MQTTFEPGTVVSIVIYLLGLAGMAGTLLYKMGRNAQKVEDKFKVQGERIGSIEEVNASNHSAIRQLEKYSQQGEFKMQELTKITGELSGRLDRFDSAIRLFIDSRSKEDMNISNRLVRVEEKLDGLIRFTTKQGGE